MGGFYDIAIPISLLSGTVSYTGSDPRSDNGQFTLVETIPPGTNDVGAAPAILVSPGAQPILDLMAYTVVTVVYAYCVNVCIYIYI